MLHSNRWTAKKLARRLALIELLVYRRSHPIPPFRYLALAAPEISPPVEASVDDHSWPVIEPQSYWGGPRINFIMRSEFQVPASWPTEAPVALSLNLGDAKEFSHPETLVYLDSEPYAACDRHHQEIAIPSHMRDGASHRLALHGWTGNLDWVTPGTRLLMQPCAVVQIDPPTREFVTLTRVALGTIASLDENEPAHGHLLDALDSAFKLLDLVEPFGDGFYESVPPALHLLREGIKQAGPALEVEVAATGHAHIDVAWLWPLAQTRRKAGRTFHTVLRLMEQFPDYHFTQSQPQLYEYVREDYPQLFEGIKQRVAEGRWEPIGDMWVEADCNLSGPESLARQFLLGRGFFKEHFNRETSRVLWLPDVFGYTWALPQLIKEAGLEYFFTIKIGWNQYNRMPYDTFWWQGIDGTRVLTHFSPTPEHPGASSSTYNGAGTAEDVIGTWTNFRQKDLAGSAGDQIPPLLMAFGYGDGGGGPTREMLENLHELKQFPAAPRVTQKPVGAFFRDLEARAGDRLPIWNGELYLELHRGTYTTQSRNKRANRKSEFMLHDAEWLASLASLVDPAFSYPSEDFKRAWRLVCLNQFHDIIPGSSITQVYVDSLRQYAEVESLAQSARDRAMLSIARSLGTDLIAANPTGFTHSDLAFYSGDLSAGESILLHGQPVPLQRTAGGAWLDLGDMPPYSVLPLSLGSGPDAAPPIPGALTVSPQLLENAYLRVELNAQGDITRIFDKGAQREVLPAGSVAGAMQAFEDRPLNWDAWDVDIFYNDKMWLADPATRVQVVEDGPLRATIEIERTILHSRYVQHISLAHNSPRLDFDTTIDWRERHILLKAAFPVDVLAVAATYEIQWGNVERPTHRNTSWDWARFETCAQKWVDLSEGDYGVSLLNDCKYGHDIHDNVIRLSLLRSSTNPDPEADQGEHRFAYSLLPHSGPLDYTTISAAYALNDPIIVANLKGSPTTTGNNTYPTILSLISADQPNIIIETIKRAEDGQGLIVRLYESRRQRGTVRLNTSFTLAAAWRTNLLEEDSQPLHIEGTMVTLNVRPYEIATLRLVPR